MSVRHAGARGFSLGPATARGNGYYGPAVLADSPVVYIGLDETSGTVAADSSGNANDFAYQANVGLGQTDLTTYGGYSVACPTTTNQLALMVPGPAAMIGATSWTLECLVNLADATVHGALMGVGSFQASNDGFGLGVGQNGWSSAGNMLVGLAAGTAYMSSGINIGTGRHHLAIARDGAGWYFYIDGTWVKTLAATNYTAPTSRLWIGGEGTSAYPASSTLIDAAAFYATALSAAAIASHAVAAGL